MLCDCSEKGDSRIMGRAGFRAMHRGNVFHGAFLENDFRILFEEGVKYLGKCKKKHKFTERHKITIL